MTNSRTGQYVFSPNRAGVLGALYDKGQARVYSQRSNLYNRTPSHRLLLWGLHQAREMGLCNNLPNKSGWTPRSADNKPIIAARLGTVARPPTGSRFSLHLDVCFMVHHAASPAVVRFLSVLLIGPIIVQATRQRAYELDSRTTIYLSGNCVQTFK